MSRRVLWLAIGLLGAITVMPLASPARGGLIYDNGTSTHSGGSAIGHMIAADDFRLPANLAITGASVDVNDGPQANNRRWDGSVRWWILKDNGGTPGDVFATGTGQNIQTSNMTESPLGFRDFTVTFDFDDPTALNGGETYWLALHFQADFSRLSVFWDHTASTVYNPAYSGIDLSGGVPSYTGTFFGTSAYDKAFRLLAANDGNKPVSQELGDQTEPSIAANPNDPNHLVAAAIDAPNDTCKVYFSFDGGTTWSTGTLNLTPSRSGCADPGVAFDSNGNAYFTGFIFNRPAGGAAGFTNTAIALARSTDGGRNYAGVRGFDVTGRREDKPYLAIDNTGGTRDGTVYVAFTTVSFTNGNDRDIRVTAGDPSNPGSFLVPQVVTGGNNWGAHPAVGPEGEVYVAWRQFNPNRIKISKSTDGGQTWTAPAVVATLGSDMFSTPPDRVGRIPVVAVSHATQNRGKVYVAYHENSPLFSSLPNYPGAGVTIYYGINKHGAAVGAYRDATGATNHYGFSLTNNEFQSIDVPGATDTQAMAVNDIGQVAGVFHDGAKPQVFTLFSGSLKTFDLSAVHNPAAGLPVFANAILVRAINNHGEIVGYYWDGVSKRHGFFLDTRLFPGHPDCFRTIDQPSASNYTELFGINDAGVIVGEADATPFIYDLLTGTFSPLDSPFTPNGGINNANEIAGQDKLKRGNVTLSLPHNARSISNNGTLLVSRSTGGYLVGYPQDQDVFVARSSDGGVTWSTVRVNDHVAGDQYLPWICAAPTGRIHISWLDRRNNPDNLWFDVYHATSLDGGRSFSTNQKVTSLPSNPDWARFISPSTGQVIDDWMGEYAGLACTDTIAYPIWPDMRNGVGQQDIYTAKLQSTLIDNGNGTVTDTDTNRMWLKDALLMFTTRAIERVTPDGFTSWGGANEWAQGLEVAGYGDWRLPRSVEWDMSCDVNGFNCTGSEMGRLYYLSLRNTAGGPLANRVPFVNLVVETDVYGGADATGGLVLDRRLHSRYWTTPTERYFQFSDGQQGYSPMTDFSASAWAVREILPINTSFGSAVQVNSADGVVTVTFDAVRDEGNTSIAISTENPGTEPEGLRFLGKYIDINTSANYEGDVRVCFSYEHSDIPGCPNDGCPTNENELKIERWNGTNWDDITQRPEYPDIENNLVCGTGTSLSWFALAEEKCVGLYCWFGPEPYPCWRVGESWICLGPIHRLILLFVLLGMIVLWSWRRNRLIWIKKKSAHH